MVNKMIKLKQSLFKSCSVIQQLCLVALFVTLPVMNETCIVLSFSPVYSVSLSSSSSTRSFSSSYLSMPYLFRHRNPNLYSSSSSSFDYEYLPPNPDASIYDDENINILSSSYPPGTPPGLRGEAVRSALLSDRCIGWNIGGREFKPFSVGGILKVHGKGMLDFINNKLTQEFSTSASSTTTTTTSSSSILLPYQEACLLTAKGRVVDRLRIVIIDSETAYIITSSGYTSQQLLERLDPFIFPMDQITLKILNQEDDDNVNNNACMFTLASSQWKTVQTTIQEQVLHKLVKSSSSVTEYKFPLKIDECARWEIPNNDDDKAATKLLLIPSTGLPSAACVGYTLIFYEDDSSSSSSSSSVGSRIWKELISEDNAVGPIELGPSEYETLRIEAGQAAYGKEFGPTITTKTNMVKASNEEQDDQEQQQEQKLQPKEEYKTSPLDLHWHEEQQPISNNPISMDKGCYLGQEGVASILKNPRGPIRSLYSIVFDDENNVYESQSRGDGESKITNLTKPPKVGDALYVLGSNEEISVGTITSIAERGGTGKPCIVGLALIRRAESILKQMKSKDLEIPNQEGQFDDPLLLDVIDVADSSSGMIEPPPLDPLDGLEVIIDGSFTVGALRMIPSRRYRLGGRNMFDEQLRVDPLDANDSTSASSNHDSSSSSSVPTSMMDMTTAATTMPNEEETVEEADNDLAILEEAAKAQAEAEAAAAEAKRKAEKMELLKKRAEEAMARRRKKKQQEQ